MIKLCVSDDEISIYTYADLPGGKMGHRVRQNHCRKRNAMASGNFWRDVYFFPIWSCSCHDSWVDKLAFVGNIAALKN